MKDIPRTSGDIAHAALAAFGVIAVSVTVIAVVESYSNLLAFARAYGLHGWRAAIAPGAVDSFIIMGELLLFAAILLAWGTAPHWLGAGMAAWGFLLSVGGNVWHATSATPVDRAVAAVWPVTATAALAGGLLIVRQVTMTSGVTQLQPVPAIEEAPREEPPPVREPRRRGPVSPVDEDALARELLALEGPLPPYRSWSYERTGMYRSAPTKRAYDKAAAAMNGASHD
jgi:hypothetical protein